MIKAALHVHSTYSDGEFTLADLREKYLRTGCRLVCMADHADAFDESKVKQYLSECEALSDARLCFMPGLEFGCVERMHIVGYGVTALVDSIDPATVIEHIRQHEGVPVIAHPPDHLFSSIEKLKILPDGVEGWNSKYDGRYAPRPATFALIGRLQAQSPALRAFYGQDMHWKTQYAGLFTFLQTSDVGRLSVLAALRGGMFEGVAEDVRLPSSGQIPPATLASFAKTSARSMRFRATLKSARKMLGRALRLLPSPVKSQLRRLF